jgi:hypothetical protein
MQRFAHLLLAVSFAVAAAPHATRAQAPGLERIPVAPPTARQRANAATVDAELRVPAGRGPFPVAILVEGGCWGRRAQPGYLRPLAEALRADGIASWSVPHRPLDGGGGWPAAYRDVADAADSVRSLARRYPIDTTRVIVLGHSTGVALAAWVATRPYLSLKDPEFGALRGGAPLRVHGVVAIDGALDLVASRPAVVEACGEGALDSLLGGTPGTHAARWRGASASRLLALAGGAVRRAVVVGPFDAMLTRRYPDAALGRWAPRSRAALFRADTLSHVAMLDPSSPSWEATRDAVRHVLGLAPEGRKGADRAALLAAYRTFAAGMHTRTMDPALALLSPGFEQRVPDGAGGMRTTPRDRFVAGISRVATSLDTLRAFAIDVTDVTIDGDSATVSYREHFDAVFRPPPSGGPARRDSSTSYWRDRWMRTADGWRALRFEQTRD